MVRLKVFRLVKLAMSHGTKFPNINNC